MIVMTYKTLLQSPFWPIIAAALSAFEQFATSLHSDSQWMLMNILTPNTQAWFHCRLAGQLSENIDAVSIYEWKYFVVTTPSMSLELSRIFYHLIGK